MANADPDHLSSADIEAMLVAQHRAIVALGRIIHRLAPDHLEQAVAEAEIWAGLPDPPHPLNRLASDLTLALLQECQPRAAPD